MPAGTGNRQLPGTAPLSMSQSLRGHGGEKKPRDPLGRSSKTARALQPSITQLGGENSWQKAAKARRLPNRPNAADCSASVPAAARCGGMWCASASCGRSNPCSRSRALAPAVQCSSAARNGSSYRDSTLERAPRGRSRYGCSWRVARGIGTPRCTACWIGTSWCIAHGTDQRRGPNNAPEFSISAISTSKRPCDNS